MQRQFWLRALSTTAVCCAALQAAWSQPGKKVPVDANYRFATGVRLLTDKQPIDVTTGHAAPYIYDFNRDGNRDLLVGEFGSGTFRGETTSDSSPLANARLRIYLNKGTDTAPRYDGFTYLQSAGENASVPST